ncbi:MAG: 3-phosphoshikimate 1-carboxyvinyltransferase [Planctomycetaceae bacterium]|nr:3-phosphoshikimate 1-carboxyvinyltransferase [Planctomycetaceae bacterium]
MSDVVEVQTVDGPVHASIRPPGSKSLTNRALVVAALAARASAHHSACRLSGVLDSDDTRVMIDSLRRLGWRIEQELQTCTVTLDGRDPAALLPPPAVNNLWLENSGTSIRFLSALSAALTDGCRVRLDGNARMRERPIQPLVDALGAWGADAACELGTSCPPVTVTARGLPAAVVPVSGDLSSQYLSALLMAAPAAAGDVTLRVEGPLVSRPYIDMTLAVMRAYGAQIEEPEPNRFHISAAGYRPVDYDVEPDASAASYFFAVAAVTGGRVTVEGLHRHSLQGDVGFVDVLEQMGCQVQWHANAITVTGGTLRGVDVDMNAISDTAQTLAAVAPFATGPTRIRGVAHMRLKETDRVSAVVTELHKLGLRVEEFDDGMLIEPGPMHPASIATYDDHRMAMSFAVLGLRQPGVRIESPGCTSKTYPRFFADLDRVCGR